MADSGFRDGSFFSLLGSKLVDLGADAFGTSVLAKATHGVIFVDEAYQLDPRGAAGAAGQKVLDRLMDHMSRHERTCTVIFAGYEAQVREGPCGVLSST
jgi:hypothetical protein